MEVIPVVLTGKIVQLQPLTLDHVPGLFAASEPSIWKYMLYGDITTESDMRGWVLDMLDRAKGGTDLPFAVVDLVSGRELGATRYLEIRPQHRSLEIGGTWYGPKYQRTGVNTECKYLLLTHAFETLGCIRVQFKSDSRNARSVNALKRIGAKSEGILRNHMILMDGTYRHSAYFSILADEWPEVKKKLEEMQGMQPDAASDQLPGQR
jgi:RimJ/RimL family protein N-acetyltransferase